MSWYIVPESSKDSVSSSGNEVAVRLENVSVLYRIPRERISTFKEYVIRLVTRRIGTVDYLALDGIDLEVCRGEVFGIIGSNGAGKSTLLKLIARVLQPTRGRVWVRGRVAPLLDVSAGFHPELTGRENVFLNGTLLGLSRRELNERFARIVDFAEMWDFIDAPLRMYSSGMIARLGFAVASDTDPDILLIDEVLTVGDAAFQRKCWDRIRGFQERGTTILLVSHDMGSVKSLCGRAVWLNKGRIKALGKADEVVSQYWASLSAN